MNIFYRKAIKMLWELYYELSRGYKINQKIDLNSLSPDVTHIVILINTDYMKFRKYTSLYDFNIQNIKSIEIAYNYKTDTYFCEEFSPYKTLDTGEFIHMHLPKERFHMYRISIDNYTSGIMKADLCEYFVPEENYMCKCDSSSKKCLYHEFITEKLYMKYIKNDRITKNSNVCNDYDDVWSMV